ncbi:hypothetical protein [Lactiplantibacillus modestisalitolerans]|uniref:Uncharacterized protein n=1 Tax=Lactiplantibacillus modestisalitolerans TaxID=1457219 RepID=A0ABV5WQY0_9LACO|nr:hypothetical protein [Lactiplantibacillus modestisalitolerans]
MSKANVPFNEQLYKVIQKAGEDGITTKRLNDTFSNHTPSSISGVLNGMKNEHRVESIGRGKYRISDKTKFAKDTNVKKLVVGDLKNVKDQYDLKLSEYNELSKIQQEQLAEALKIIENAIEDLTEED